MHENKRLVVAQAVALSLSLLEDFLGDDLIHVGHIIAMATRDV